MIEIIGPENIPEFEAAQNIRSKLLEQWPDLEKSKQDRVCLYVSGKLFGYERRDFDVVLIASFKRPRNHKPRREFRSGDGQAIRPLKCNVWSLFLIFEVKRHDSRAIVFDGLTASVRYRAGGQEVWENASEQSHEQLWTMKTYLKEQKLADVYPTNLIYLPNLDRKSLPPGSHNFISGDMKFSDILDILGQISRPLVKGMTATLSAAKSGAMESLFETSIFRRIKPSPLDRRRMDLIARKEAHRSNWFEELGSNQVLLRGRGGAGKTVLLLQMAYRAYQESGARSLFLTYNQALIADVRRTMHIFQIPGTLARGGIQVESVMSLIGKVMKHFELIDEDADFLEDYKSIGRTFMEYLEAGTITPDDIAAMKAQNGDRYGFDYVFIDEGQDWTAEEVHMIRTLYSSNRLVVADGVDQFVRDEIADWRLGLEQKDVQQHNLRKCLRMKSNLARFCNAFAEELGLIDWRVQPNEDVGGGRVVVRIGEYDFDADYNEKLLQRAFEAGNKPIDLLVCAPPSWAVIDNGSNGSRLARTLESSGREVWDGLTETGRRTIAVSSEAYRLVQYDSSRGLEGWIVFALAFDEFWNFKKDNPNTSTEFGSDMFASAEEEAHLVAARWCMIAMTRAIDELVINVRDADSEIATVLRRVLRGNSEFMEWYE
jgi:hypothetical protein